MKALILPLICLGLGAGACRAENPVPFENFNFSIDVADSWKRIFSNSGGKFAVTMGVYQDDRRHRPQCSINIYCRGLQKEPQLGLDDVKAMAEVAAAAAARKSLKKEVAYDSSNPAKQVDAGTNDLKTTFESARKSERSDEWVVSMKRTDTPVALSLRDVAELQQMAKQANDSILWYETLLTAPEVPRPTEIAKPPVGSIRSFYGLIGNIESGKMRYQVYLLKREEWNRGPEGIIHSLRISSKQHARGGSTTWENGILVMEDGFPVFEGEWVRDMMIHITHAAAAAQKKEVYSFIENHEGLRYEVRADPDEKTAKLRIHPNFANSDLSYMDAVYSLDEARQIATLINQAKESETWFKEYQELFVTPAP